jgi:uncharacterized protein DUF6790
MYFISVILLLIVFPAGSVAIDLVWGGGADKMALIGKWFVFWAIGVRLFLAGMRRVARPQFTAEDIFEIRDKASFAIVREVGFGNLAMGALGLLSLAQSTWVFPAAIVGGLYYGLAGIGHAVRGKLNFSGWVALTSDFFIFGLLALFLASRGLNF